MVACHEMRIKERVHSLLHIFHYRDGLFKLL